MTRDQVPADLVAKEKRNRRRAGQGHRQAPAIAEKIAEGKMRVFFEEKALLDQKFVKDDSKTITQLLKEAGTTLESYARVEVGQ